jgi:uncharacterized membrane protein ArfB
MTFLEQCMWYLTAFLAGSVVAWVITILAVRRTSEQEVLADLPGSRAIGPRR